MSLPLITLGSPVADKKPRPPREPRIKRVARFLLPFIITTTTLPPAAYAAPNPSLLAQQPNYISVSLEPNVALIVDDSRSMEDIRLPLPAGLSSAASANSVVNTRGRATGYAVSGGWSVTDFEKEFRNGSTWDFQSPADASKNEVERDKEWIYRSANLNPLYYNPSIRYTPWNDNGRAGATGNFKNAPFGEGTALAGLFVPGTTPHDMRYAGPNRRYNEGKNLSRLRDPEVAANRGANPPALDEEVQKIRAAQGGFAGARHHVDTTASQDLFASLFVRASGTTNVCTAPTTPLTQDDPVFKDRDKKPQPTTSLLANRPSIGADLRARTTFDRDTEPGFRVERGKEPREFSNRAGPFTANNADAVNARDAQKGTLFQAPTPSARTLTNRKTEGTAVPNTPFVQARTVYATSHVRALSTTRESVSKPLDQPRTSARAFVVIDPINRSSNPREDEPKKTDFTRDVRDRPSRAIAVDVDRTVRNRTQEWRYESGVCGKGEANYAWTTESPYGPDGTTVVKTCSKAGEGIKAATVFGTRFTACDIGTVANPGPEVELSTTQCITRCGHAGAGTLSTPFEKTGTFKCEARCNTGPYTGESRVDTVAGGVMTASRCFASECNPSQSYETAKWSGYENLGTTQCRQTCNTTYYTVSGDETQCIAKCAAGQYDTGTGLCLKDCQASFGPPVGTGTWEPSPASGSVPTPDPASTVCRRVCDSPTHPHLNPLNSWQCVNTKCDAPGSSKITVGGQDRCYSDCPNYTTTTSNTFGVPPTPGFIAQSEFNDVNGQETLCQLANCGSNAWLNATTSRIFVPNVNGLTCTGSCRNASGNNVPNPFNANKNFGTDSLTVTGTSGLCYRDDCGTDAQGQTIDLAADASGNLTRCQPRCQDGYTFDAAENLCKRACAGTTIDGVCYNNCPSGYSPSPDASGKLTQCKLSTGICPTGTTLNGDGTICLGGCPSGSTSIGGTCYSNTQCQNAGDTLHPTDGTRCLAPCPGNWVRQSNVLQCLSCPSTPSVLATNFPIRKQTDFSPTPNRDTDQCWAPCPAGTSPAQVGSDPADPAKCFSCSSYAFAGPPVVTPTLSVTNSAPAGAAPNYVAQCLESACGTGQSRIWNSAASKWQCWGGCTETNHDFVNQATSTQCRLSCSAAGLDMDAAQANCLKPCSNPAFPDKYANNSLYCYKDCSSGFAAVSGTKECRTACTGAGEYEISNAQCGKCTVGDSLGLKTDKCYLDCNDLTPLDGKTANAWTPATDLSTNPPQCRSSVCPGPTSGPEQQWTISSDVCRQNCGVGETAGLPNLSGGFCYGDCPSDFPITDQTPSPGACWKCDFGVPQTIAGARKCLSCTSSSTLTQLGDPAKWSCCPTGNLQTGGCNPEKVPSGFSCADGTWAPDLRQPALARYYVYAPAAGASSPNEVQSQHYVLVEINRHRQHDYPRAEGRTDCVKKKDQGLCTWDEEAQNFANWYTYYRTRLQAAIAVTSESLSALASPIGVQRVRLAYGSINYFANGQNPYAAPSGINCESDPGQSASCRYASSLSVDGVNLAAGGAVVRGVRPFQRNPDVTGVDAVGVPADPGSDDRTQEVFDWLFSLRTPTFANTPLREAMNSVGRYFQRDDDRSPWIQPSTSSELSEWKTAEKKDEHLQCRRNYLLMITDGEWTRTPSSGDLLAQPLIENDSTATTNALSINGDLLKGPGGREYQYLPNREKHFSNNAGSGNTLSDIAFYYWSRDLRTDLEDAVPPIAASTGTQGNPAFWQHMTSFVIGYGISSYMDSAYTDASGKKVRDLLASAAVVQPPTATNAIAWPSVVFEGSTESVTSDRDPACGYNASTKPSGCGRVDDVFRAAMASRGNFLSASNVDTLTQSIRDVFKEISVQDVSGTAIAGRSSNLQLKDRLFTASYTTSKWNGRLVSYNAIKYLANEGTPFPAWRDSNPANRVIMTATKEGVVKPGASFTWGTGGISDDQKTALGGSVAGESVLKWLRGDHSDEQRQTSPSSKRNLRNRENGEFLGTIINSQPVYSKVTDWGYATGREPAAAVGQGGSYRTFVNKNSEFRRPRLFLGSNIGMLHAFDAKGQPVDGEDDYNANHLKEEFAYVPRAVYANNMLARLASPAYTHRYLMDGPIVEGDVYTGTSWKSVIVGTTGAGPKGVFALDVTLRPDSKTGEVPVFGTSNVLWDITANDTNQGGALDHLGHILQPGIIGSGKDGKWYYFVGNGYESTSDKARLLAINIATGAITVIGPASGQIDDGGNKPSATATADRPNGLGGITPVYDAKRNIVAVYAGDRLGRVWKFDLSSQNPSDWTGKALFVAHRGASADDADARQPITAAPRIVPHPYGGRMVVVGTGKLFETPDAASSAVESVYAIWERNPSSLPSEVIKKTSVHQLTLAEEVVKVDGKSTTLRKLTGIGDIDWLGKTPDLGWYFDLQVGTGPGGERVVVSPIEDFGFVNITSFLPLVDNDPCAGSGKSYFYRLDVTGNFTRLPFNGVTTTTSTPLSSLIGAELAVGSVAQATPLRPPPPALTSPEGGTSVTLSQNTIESTLGTSGTNDPNPPRRCGRVPGLAPELSCSQGAVRVWREMPRGAR